MFFLRVFLFFTILALSLPTFSSSIESKGQLVLSFSDGRASVSGISDVNKYLMSVGVRVSETSIPKSTLPIIKKSKERALRPDEHSALIEAFSLNREDLLEQISLAGRKPAVAHGGYLTTSEPNVAPYPKVYDMMSMTEETKHYLQHKFGKLHVNSSEKGQGIDEVMTIISGGHWTWFFVLADGVVGKLTLGYVDEDSKAWRISYPGIVAHGGFFDSAHGLVVAYAHGPEQFIMRYQDESVDWSETLGGNPWIDFSEKTPLLLSEVPRN